MWFTLVKLGNGKFVLSLRYSVTDYREGIHNIQQNRNRCFSTILQ